MKSTLLGGAACLLSTVCALGADMGVPIAIPPALPPFTWTGCYAGGQAGGGSDKRISMILSASFLQSPILHPPT